MKFITYITPVYSNTIPNWMNNGWTWLDEDFTYISLYGEQLHWESTVTTLDKPETRCLCIYVDSDVKVTHWSTEPCFAVCIKTSMRFQSCTFTHISPCTDLDLWLFDFILSVLLNKQYLFILYLFVWCYSHGIALSSHLASFDLYLDINSSLRNCWSFFQYVTLTDTKF